jgi:hypothetical protein
LRFSTAIDVQGRISKAGDPDLRRAFYEAASAMLTRYKGKTALKSWGQKTAKRCHKKAVVAVAASSPSSCTRCGGTALPTPIAACRQRRADRQRAQASRLRLGVLHDVQKFVQPPTGIRLTPKEIRSSG